MSDRMRWPALIASALLCAACASHEEPAKAAVTDLATSIDALRAEATQLAPAALEAAEGELRTLEEALARGEHKKVVDAAPKAREQVAALAAAVAEGRAERQSIAAAAGEEWRSLLGEVPPMMAAIEARIAALGLGDPAPAEVPPATLQNARDNLLAMKSAWTQALAIHQAGNAVDAVAKGQAIREKGREVMRELERRG